MPKKKQMPNHGGLVSKMGNKKEYTNYVMSGGTSDFKPWKKEHNK